MENTLKKTCGQQYFYMSSVCLLLQWKNSLKKTCEKQYFNMSSVRLLFQWKIRFKKLVKSDNLICLVYVSFCNGKSLKKTCEKR